LIIFNFILRNYQRKTNKCCITQEQLKTALKSAKDSRSFRAAAARFGVPKLTLYDYQSKPGEAPRLGKKTVLSLSIEEELRKYFLDISAIFFGMTPMRLRFLTHQLAERNGIDHPFNKTKKRAGKHGYYAFMFRNPKLSL
jgi:hypothetical protein